MTHTYDELKKFFNMQLDKLALNLNYKNDNILILQGNEQELKEKYPDIYNNILSCAHNRDNRTPMQYARDLVASWLYEDYIVKKFKELGYELCLSGKDKERRILNNTKVGSDCDLIFKHDNKLNNIEIVNDYSSYWKRNKKLDLRDSKYNKLISSRCILLAISISDKTYALIPITEDLKFVYIKSHLPFGGKPAYQIDIKNIEFKEFKVSNIIDDLLMIIQK